MLFLQKILQNNIKHYKNICKSWLRRKKYGVFDLNLIFMTFRREYGISTSFYLLASLLYKPVWSLIPSLIRCTEEWNYHYEVIMSLTDAAVIFGPFNESFISLRNMDRFCVNLQTNIISNVKDSKDGIWSQLWLKFPERQYQRLRPVSLNSAIWVCFPLSLPHLEMEVHPASKMIWVFLASDKNFSQDLA